MSTYAENRICPGGPAGAAEPKLIEHSEGSSKPASPRGPPGAFGSFGAAPGELSSAREEGALSLADASPSCFAPREETVSSRAEAASAGVETAASTVEGASSREDAPSTCTAPAP